MCSRLLGLGSCHSSQLGGSPCKPASYHHYSDTVQQLQLRICSSRHPHERVQCLTNNKRNRAIDVFGVCHGAVAMHILPLRPSLCPMFVRYNAIPLSRHAWLAPQLPRFGAHIYVKSQPLSICTSEKQRAGTICVEAMMAHEGAVGDDVHAIVTLMHARIANTL